MLDRIVWTAHINMNYQYQKAPLQNSEGFQCTITFVYASNTYTEREQLWKLLILNANSMHIPWIAPGDFNSALHPKHKKGGLTIPFSYLNF